MTITPQAYVKQLPVGVPGDITRMDESAIESGMLVAVSGVFAQAFGIPLVYVAGGFSQYTSANTAAQFAGVLVREAPGISSSGDNISSLPYSSQLQGICTRGYVSVVCTVGTPARGGIVYICNNTAGGSIGDFQATSSANNVALSLTQASWASDGKDANNNAEIRVAR